MNEQRFTLEPFHSEAFLPDLKIAGTVSRHLNIISMSYALWGPLAEAVIPAASEAPSRQNELWEETCFELFLGGRGSDQYWEFNLSPSGNWNVYRFDAYREGMEEEKAFVSLPFSVKNEQDELLLELEFSLDNIIPEDEGLEAAVSAVIKLKDGRVIYWAMTHPGTEPDFHHRDGFVIEL